MRYTDTVSSLIETVLTIRYIHIIQHKRIDDGSWTKDAVHKIKARTTSYSDKEAITVFSSKEIRTSHYDMQKRIMYYTKGRGKKRINICLLSPLICCFFFSLQIKNKQKNSKTPNTKFQQSYLLHLTINQKPLKWTFDLAVQIHTTPGVNILNTFANLFCRLLARR